MPPSSSKSRYRIAAGEAVDKFPLGSPWIEASPRYLRTRAALGNSLADSAAQTMRRANALCYLIDKLCGRLDGEQE